LSSKIKLTSMSIFPSKEMPEYVWCTEQFGRESYYNETIGALGRWACLLPSELFGLPNVIFSFNDDEDAALFILTWGGNIIT
jgi:hypothetical protein